MIDFSAWKSQKLSVDAVQLDGQNPRLPEYMHGEKPRAIIHYLIEHFDVLNLAKSIVEHGFFINETPIVTKEGTKHVVLEGNRRLAALKLLRNPNLAPPSKQPTYVRLAEDFSADEWAKIQMHVAPNRSVAGPVILARHGSELAQPWGRLMKMRFIAGDVLSGVPYEEIGAKFSIPKGEVRTAALTIMLRELIHEADIAPDLKERLLNERVKRLSTLTRIVESSPFRKLTGLKLKGNSLTTKISKADFIRILVDIWRDVFSRRKGRPTSRTLHTNEDIDDYLKNRVGDVPASDKGFKYTPESPEDKPEEKKPTKSGPDKTPEKLIPERWDFVTGNQKLDDLIVEGQRLSFTYKFSAALLLRTILDLSVIELYTINGKRKEAVKQNGKSVDLTVRIKGLYNKHSDWLEKATRDRLKRFVDGGNESYIHIETLNDVAHSDYFGKPSKTDLKNFWGVIKPLVESLLQED